MSRNFGNRACADLHCVLAVLRAEKLPQSASLPITWQQRQTCLCITAPMKPACPAAPLPDTTLENRRHTSPPSSLSPSSLPIQIPSQKKFYHIQSMLCKWIPVGLTLTVKSQGKHNLALNGDAYTTFRLFFHVFTMSSIMRWLEPEPKWWAHEWRGKMLHIIGVLQRINQAWSPDSIWSSKKRIECKITLLILSGKSMRWFIKKYKIWVSSVVNTMNLRCLWRLSGNLSRRLEM